VTGKAGYNAPGLRGVPGPCRRNSPIISDPNIARSQALAPVDRETLLQTTNKATDHRHTDGAHHRHEQSGSSSASMTNRLAMVVIWSDAQQTVAENRGVVTEDFGEAAEVGVAIADKHIAGPARR
jgi:hypothetical protein